MTPVAITKNRGRSVKKYIVLLGCGIAMTSTAVQAAETVTYTYDAKGRLVEVVHSGTVNNGLTTTYSHDKADNRTNATTTNAP
jgi:hypothetical protein